MPANDLTCVILRGAGASTIAITRAVFNLFEALGSGIMGPLRLGQNTILFKQVNSEVVEKKKSRLI